ncbi:hypothetical protein EDM57_04840 [Brevibacillus gelatini]|uniref:Uncharacterized protein n=1 Tax=Brevibacillus gelatini TaxID=1655277 RepID=A0A3M8B7P1_9BACL|nr:hypothetical protein [Brevibacillus gelatini]RNB59471.1 hypothetical protein EDM57_04840 [Brevibacillus gelatini]
MNAVIECLETKYELWKVGEQYEVILTWDSNSRLLHTTDRDKFERFWNYPKDKKGYYRHDYKTGELIEGAGVLFKIIQLG